MHLLKSVVFSRFQLQIWTAALTLRFTDEVLARNNGLTENGRFGDDGASSDFHEELEKHASTKAALRSGSFNIGGGMRFNESVLVWESRGRTSEKKRKRD